MPSTAADVPPTFKKSRRFQNKPSLSIAFVSYTWRDRSIGTVAWGIISSTSSDAGSNERSSSAPKFAKLRSWRHSAPRVSTSDLICMHRFNFKHYVPGMQVPRMRSNAHTKRLIKNFLPILMRLEDHIRGRLIPTEFMRQARLTYRATTPVERTIPSLATTLLPYKS
jgi:hypothetical protein